MKKLVLIFALVATLALPSGAYAVEVSDGGTVCGRWSQGTFLTFYVNGTLTTYYCHNSGDPLNGPFYWGP